MKALLPASIRIPAIHNAVSFTEKLQVGKCFLTAHFEYDTGTEELGHLEMVGSLVAQLSKGTMGKEWNELNSAEYYADNGACVYPQNSQGSPFTAASIAVTGDPLTNLYEDLAAEATIMYS